MNTIKNLNKIFFMTIILMMSIIFLEGDIVQAKSEIIYNDETGIPDKALYQEILSHLLKNEDAKITREEAERITSLRTFLYPQYKIKSLKGIENLKNLTELRIEKNGLTELGEIGKLTELRILQIDECKLKNISGLEQLTNLELFSIEGGEIKDWSPLNGLTKLEKLNLDNCGLNDSNIKSIVSEHCNLKGLGIVNNNMSDLNVISNLTELQSLCIENCNLNNINGISKFENLLGLSLKGNNISDISELDKMTKLKELYLCYNRISDISGLEKLENLTDLDLSYNKIKKLVNLKPLKNLDMQFTKFEHNKISKEEFKKNLPYHIRINKWYILNQYIFQDLKKKLVIRNAKKIKKGTRKIKGVTEERATVVLKTAKGKKISKVKADKNGRFVFKKLNLTKYKGKKLKMIVYLRYDDHINSEGHLVDVRTVNIKVR